MTDFVFLGPSLARADAVGLHDAMYLEPVAMGDLYLLANEQASPGDRIAIIDGFFEQVPAVWHKEILFAMERGIEVHGASSMGALRAAELDRFGMIGHGRIYRAYRDGRIEDDDEVAVAHATAEQQYRSLSDAMASIRLGLADLYDEEAITADQRDELLGLAKSSHYSRRSWAVLVAHARKAGWAEPVVAALLDYARTYDAKAEDARQLLTHLSATRANSASVRGERLQRTSFWESLVSSSKARSGSGSQFAPDAQSIRIAAQVRAADRDRDEILMIAKALNAHGNNSATQLASWELVDAAFFVSRRNGLKNADEVQKWRDRQGLGDDQVWRAFLGRIASARRDLAGVDIATTQAIDDALRLTGKWEAAAQRNAVIEEQFGSDYDGHISLADAGLSAEEAEQWYQERLGPLLPTPEAHAARFGFETLRDMVANMAAVARGERHPG